MCNGVKFLIEVRAKELKDTIFASQHRRLAESLQNVGIVPLKRPPLSYLEWVFANRIFFRPPLAIQLGTAHEAGQIRLVPLMSRV